MQSELDFDDDEQPSYQHDDDIEDLQPLTLETSVTLLDELFALAQQQGEQGRYLELLRFVARFKRYSSYNAMLVYAQMPGAIYVLPARRWMKDYRRLPKRDAQRLVMLRPQGPIMFAYDVSQTEGDPMPKGFEDPFAVYGSSAKDVLERTIRRARAEGIDVGRQALGSTLGGYVRNAGSSDHDVAIRRIRRPTRTMRVKDKDVPVVAEIVLNGNLSDETNFATLTHELGHLYCGHVGTQDPKSWPDRRGLSHYTQEFEAESVSFLVCQRAGLTSPAAEYLHGYVDEHGKVPQIGYDIVFKVAQRVEAMGRSARTAETMN